MRGVVHSTAKWNKPKEIAHYEGLGFEVAATATRNGKPHIDPARALELWQNSPPHRNVLASCGSGANSSGWPA